IQDMHRWQPLGSALECYVHETGGSGIVATARYARVSQHPRYLCLSDAINMREAANLPLSTFPPNVFRATSTEFALVPTPTLVHQANQVVANHHFPAAQDKPESHPTSFHLHVCTWDV